MLPRGLRGAGTGFLVLRGPAHIICSVPAQPDNGVSSFSGFTFRILPSRSNWKPQKGFHL